MHDRLNSPKEKGFTLLELMMSLIILSVAFLGILPMFFYSQAQIKEATLTNKAISIIQQRIARINSLQFDEIDFRDFNDDPLIQYTYIMPEVLQEPCVSNPGVCGFIPSINMLREIIVSGGYYFTMIIDIDDPTETSSYEPGDTTPPDNLTKRVTIRVSWTIPGGRERSVSTTTEIFNSEAEF
jgi:prepilin-type N-terminal cleavage/methylation domain-containing protein